MNKSKLGLIILAIGLGIVGISKASGKSADVQSPKNEITSQSTTQPKEGLPIIQIDKNPVAPSSSEPTVGTNPSTNPPPATEPGNTPAPLTVTNEQISYSPNPDKPGILDGYCTYTFSDGSTQQRYVGSKPEDTSHNKISLGCPSWN